MLISIIIPVLNEQKSIEKIVKKVLKENCVGEIIIVDDGSTDKTSEILQKLSKNKKIKLIKHDKNLGKGRAIITGLSKISYKYILIQDADLEYNPEEYPTLLKKIKTNNAVFGSRLITKNKHAYNRTYFGNLILTFLINLLFQTNLTDSYTCYKLIPTKIMKKLNLYSNGFEIEAEITAKLAKNNIKIVEVPIKYLPRRYEEGKKIKALDAIKGIIVMCKEKFL